MKVDVLLVVDNAFRELSGLTIIKHYLEGMGYIVRFTSRFSIRFALTKHRPKMVILSSAIYTYIPELSEVCFVCVLPSESGNGQKAQILATHAGTVRNHLHTKNVDMFFSWGKQMSDWLVKEGAYVNEQIVTTGNPSTDHWMINRNRKITNKVGITTTLRSFANVMTSNSDWFMENMYICENKGWDGSYYTPPHHIEDWMYWELSFLRVICNFVKELAILDKVNFQIRPHPFEDAAKYNYLDKISSGLVTIKKQGVITEWFQNIDILITYMSASAIDAFIYGLPVVSTKNFISKQALENIPSGFIYDYYDYFWEPKDMNEIREIIQDGLKGKLELSPKKKEMSEYIKENFHFPRQKPSGQLIAEEIDSFLKKTKPREFKKSPKTLSPFDSGLDILCKIPLSEETILFLNYLKEKIQRKGNSTGFYYTYHPWNLKLKIKSKETLAEILNSI